MTTETFLVAFDLANLHDLPDRGQAADDELGEKCQLLISQAEEL